jgi:dihydrodipicolinate synthase/N-acetylneuraminate lyase
MAQETGIATLRGIFPALVTPLDGDGDVDRLACRRLVDHVIGGGVQGVLVLGSSGECATLDPSARRYVAETVAESVAGRCPILVGIAQPSLHLAIQDAQMAAAVGAVGVLVTPPYYGPVETETVAAFYRQLAEKSPLPLLAYNIPGFTHVAVPPSIVITLADEGVLHGLKDSGRDFDYFQQLAVGLRHRPAFRLLTGSDTLLLPALRSGAHGGITIGANVVPHWCAALYQAASSGEWPEAERLQARLIRLSVALRRGPFPVGAKTALSLLGVCGEEPSRPTRTLTGPERETLVAELEALGVGQAEHALAS